MIAGRRAYIAVENQYWNPVRGRTGCPNGWYWLTTATERSIKTWGTYAPGFSVYHTVSEAERKTVQCMDSGGSRRNAQ